MKGGNGGRVILWSPVMRSDGHRLLIFIVAAAPRESRVAATWPIEGMRERDSVSVHGVRRAKAAFFSGCESHPATIAPAGSNRSSHGGNDEQGVETE